MKQIKFDARFKEAILKKEMVATIRNSKKVDVGDSFEVVVGCEVIGVRLGKAEILGVLKISNKRFFMELEERVVNFPYINISLFINEFRNPIVGVRLEELGFNSWVETLETYKTYLKNKHCYLHIFELIEG